MDREHFRKMLLGKDVWNQWRQANPDVVPDLSEAPLSGQNLSGMNLTKVNFRAAQLSRSNLRRSDLTGADLYLAYLHNANLSRANLSEANLREASFYHAKLVRAILHNADFEEAELCNANLRRADLFRTKLRYVDARMANFNGAQLVETDFTDAELFHADINRARIEKADLSYVRLLETEIRNSIIKDSTVHGISAWRVDLEGTEQSNLTITGVGESKITVDNLEVAQFIYLLFSNRKIREVIDTITSKVVLILGRFTPERKAILDALREALRERDYLPVIFDFDSPASRDISETVSLLAHMSRFIIADITDPRSIPQELQLIVPNLVSVPVQPLIHTSASEYGMFEHFKRYEWVLEVFRYNDLNEIIASLKDKIIAVAEAKVKELSSR